MNWLKSIYAIGVVTISLITTSCESTIEGGSDYTPPVYDGNTIKVMSYNMYDQNKASLEDIGEVIKNTDPDIIGLQEVTLIKNGVNTEERLKEITGMQYSLFAKALDDNSGVPYGNLILSKTPFTHTETHVLGYLIDTYYRSIGIVKTNVNGNDVYFATTHLDHKDDINRIYQTEQILGHIKDLDGNFIICGDFNGDESSESIAMLKNDRFSLGCVNNYCPPTVTVPKPNKAIDFILFSTTNFYVKEYDADYSAFTQSDHFPVYATFIFK